MIQAKAIEEEVSGAFAREVGAMLADHVQRAEALIASVRETASSLFEIPFIPAGGADMFVMARALLGDAEMASNHQFSYRRLARSLAPDGVARRAHHERTGCRNRRAGPAQRRSISGVSTCHAMNS